jgi:hypothetical protein
MRASAELWRNPAASHAKQGLWRVLVVTDVTAEMLALPFRNHRRLDLGSRRHHRSGPWFIVWPARCFAGP